MEDFANLNQAPIKLSARLIKMYKNKPAFLLAKLVERWIDH